MVMFQLCHVHLRSPSAAFGRDRMRGIIWHAELRTASTVPLPLVHLLVDGYELK